MAAEWRAAKLGEVLGSKGYIRGPFGSALKRGELLTAGIPVYEQQHAIYGTREFRFFIDDAKYQELARFTVQPNDLIISCSGTLGRVSVIREGDPVGIISQALLILRPDTQLIDPSFLYYVLSSPAGFHSMVSVSTGSVQVNIAKRSIIEDIDLQLPPLPEQKAIARILGTLDDKIELNRRMNATLEAMARALFQSWFVDFDPVHAKAAGRPPSGMDAATAALFPSAFQSSALGEIPEGWTADSVSNVFHLTMGQSPPGDTYNEAGEGTPFYQGRTDFGFRFPTRRMFCTAPTRLAKECDTLVSVRAPVGDINMAIEDCCIGRGVAAVRHKQAAHSFTYYAMANLRPHFANYESEGTVFGAINKVNFEKLPVVAPSREVLTAFEKLAGPIDEQIRINETQSRALATLRDTLLPKLLSGELSTATAA